MIDAPVPNALASSPKPSGNPVALVVEDEALIQWMLVEFLEDGGYLVLCAGSIAEAREIMDANPVIEVFLLDSGLPDGDGLSLVPEIRERFPGARIAASTGKNAIDIPGVAFLPKPYGMDEIQRFLTGVTNSGKGPAS